MKHLILILLLSPIFCFSQSSTDCPTWDNKNKPKNKADYYRSLRSKKPMKGADTSKNNYTYSKPKAATNKSYTEQPTVKKTEIKKDTVSVAKKEVKEKEEKKKTKRLPPRKTTKARRKKTTGCPQF